MPIVLQLVKRMRWAPEVPEPRSFDVRNFIGEQDIDHFLRLRERAFAREKVGVRHWDAADFEAEISAKPWWTPERTWFAVPRADFPAIDEPVGMVTLAQRGSGSDSVPAIHWLAVDPRHRRRGVAALLIAHVEAYCWREGFREIYLETHAAWTAAAAFYERLGYRPVTSGESTVG